MQLRRILSWWLVGLAGCAAPSPVGQPPISTPEVEVAPTSSAVTSSRPPEQAPAPKQPALVAVECEQALEVGQIDRQAPLGTPGKVERRYLMDPHFGGQAGFYAVTRQAPMPRQETSAPLEIEIDGPRRLGPAEPLALELTFRNRSGKPLLLLRPLDGSLERWRFPTYDLYAREHATGATYRFAFVGGRCGNVNRITEDDYVELAPGASRSDVATKGWARHLAQGTLAKPGRYSVWVVYSFCGFEGRGLPLGEHVTKPAAHQGVYASNALDVEVR